jgi:hypothetical protein
MPLMAFDADFSVREEPPSKCRRPFRQIAQRQRSALTGCALIIAAHSSVERKHGWCLVGTYHHPFAG